MRAISGDSLAIDRKSRARVLSTGVLNRPVEERICDFDDVVIPLDPETAMFEASRCVQCPDPAPCVLACPAHNDIPSAMWLIEQGKFLEAAQLYHQTSSMPEICGRVCPHEQLCQGSCTRVKSTSPVLTGALEAFVIDYERSLYGRVDIPVGQSTGKKVAIVGSGPAGMACAEQLVQNGHQVTIFEMKPATGGLLTYGIPGFKLPNQVVDNRLQDLERAGVEFVSEICIGKEKTIDDLFNDGYHAVFVGVGAEIDAPMEVPGEDLPGVYKATEFLMRGNVDPALLPVELREKPAVGRKVAVIGGGDTASDCLRTALRLGAEEVVCLYRRTEKEMPGGRHDRELAREEGAEYQFLTQPVRFIAGEDGRLAQIECIRMELGEPDAKGRRRPVPVEGSNFIVDADCAVLALGYWPDTTIGDSTPDLKTHKYGLIIVDPATGATSRPGVYAGGDGVTGPDLVVTAMVAGRKAAQAMDEYLSELD
ncbi:MAG: NAD(P)-dependent oxidoreductase [Anaerolineales bacterium]|nr:NAD(P)-dependent oxidoreductase [Anaerolineales bacterium]